MMHNNPWNDSGFKLQIVLLTFAPAFLAAGVYLNLRHLVITFGASFSRIKPVSYTRIFISCDIFSIILQGAGGGIASAATNTQKGLLDAGNGLMIAGMVFQVATLLLFGLFAAEYGIRVWKHKNELNPATFTLRRSMMFKSFLGALTLAYVAILIRCVYRVAEMSGGWGNSIMKEEALFTALDSLSVTSSLSKFLSYLTNWMQYGCHCYDCLEYLPSWYGLWCQAKVRWEIGWGGDRERSGDEVVAIVAVGSKSALHSRQWSEVVLYWESAHICAGVRSCWCLHGYNTDGGV
jgi:hypothetical protein